LKMRRSKIKLKKLRVRIMTLNNNQLMQPKMIK
jgi:hypothetical protein